MYPRPTEFSEVEIVSNYGEVKAGTPGVVVEAHNDYALVEVDSAKEGSGCVECVTDVVPVPWEYLRSTKGP